MSQHTPIAFVDVESTGLDPFIHDVWEIAVIRRDNDVDSEHVFRIQPNLDTADPKALEINRYHERTSAPDWQWDDPQDVAQRLYPLLNGAVMVGSNAPFDAEMIAHLFGGYYAQPKPWHYRVIDVATLAAGLAYGKAEAAMKRDCDGAWYGKVREYLGWPWKSYSASEAIGVPRPAETVAHTALGDARWARDVFDTVTLPDAFYAATDEELSDMVGEALSNEQDAA